MNLLTKVAAISFVALISQPVYAAGDYAMLAEAVSKLIENANLQASELQEIKSKMGTLDEFDKKRVDDKNALTRIDDDVTRLLLLQSQMERMNNDNKIQSDDINKLIRDLHESQIKIQNLESAQGNDEARRLADKAARIDKQSYDLQGIVVKRDTMNDSYGKMSNSKDVDIKGTNKQHEEEASGYEKNALDVDILKGN